MHLIIKKTQNKITLLNRYYHSDIKLNRIRQYAGDHLRKHGPSGPYARRLKADSVRTNDVK